MKTKFVFAILAVLLCLSLSLSSCDRGSSEEKSPEDLADPNTFEPTDKLGGGGTATLAAAIDNTANEDSIKNAADEILASLTSDVSKEGAVELTDRSITESGKYVVSGEWKDGIEIAKGLKVHLLLDGADISSEDGIALSSAKGCEITITLIGEENEISNGVDGENALHIKGSLTINGEGSLKVTSGAKNGIKVSKTLTVIDATLLVSADNHAIAAESVVMTNATVEVTSAGKDGIQAECDYDEPDDISKCVFTTEKGFIILKNVNYTAYTLGDGLQADTFVFIDGGRYNIRTEGNFVEQTAENTEKYELEADDFKFIKNGSSYLRVASDYRGRSTLYALAQGCKAIKVGEIEFDSDGDGTDEIILAENTNYTIMINSGTFVIDATDDAIHSNSGNIIINGGDYVINTLDDAFGADYLLKVNGGNIRVEGSYEGMEGSYVEIGGGIIDITSGDDGINAASDYDDITEHIIISGGDITVDASGDGIDSNGSFLMTDGSLTVHGPTAGDNGSLDSELGVLIKGGKLFASSTLGMTETPARNSTQNSLHFATQTTLSEGSKIILKDANEKEIFSVELFKDCQTVIISLPELVTGESYSIYNDSTLLESFTADEGISSVGVPMGGMGRPNGDFGGMTRPEGDFGRGPRPEGEFEGNPFPQGEPPEIPEN